uniref:Uncharacterized protein n=1 Tax=Anguilla anguilla TaxID=7936 RepID=A0A0E9Q7R9_ANGAN
MVNKSSYLPSITGGAEKQTRSILFLLCCVQTLHSFS